MFHFVLIEVLSFITLFNVHLIHQMAGQCGHFFHPRHYNLRSVTFIALRLLISDIEPNPGPGPIKTNLCKLQLGCININSVANKGTLIIDMINNYGLVNLLFVKQR